MEPGTPPTTGAPVRSALGEDLGGLVGELGGVAHRAGAGGVVAEEHRRAPGEGIAPFPRPVDADHPLRQRERKSRLLQPPGRGVPGPTTLSIT